MRSDTLRQWLSDSGCTFEQHPRERGQGPAQVTVRRGEHKSVLPLVGSTMDLDPDAVRRIVEDLKLDWSELPGPSSRV